jgi:hypothetical protein
MAGLRAQTFEYVDEHGNLHYTDQPQLVPHPRSEDVDRSLPEEQLPASPADSDVLDALEAGARQAADRGQAAEAATRYAELGREAQRLNDLRLASRAFLAASDSRERVAGPQDPDAARFFKKHTALLRALDEPELAQHAEDARLDRLKAGDAQVEP